MVNTKSQKLTPKEKAFCQYYIECGNGTEAVKRAGYTCKNDAVAGAKACDLLKKSKIQEEIHQIQENKLKPSIMTANEVMEHFTAIARGEEKDQFGLDIGAGDRIKALVELAKRTVDIENRASGKADAKVTIEVDWKR